MGRARLLTVGAEPAFELSYWCGTCQFVFRCLEGAKEGGSVEGFQERLSRGIDGVGEDVVEQFGAVLPHGDYLPSLMKVRPSLVTPSHPDDYFANEQVDTWGLESFWTQVRTRPSFARKVPRPSMLCERD